MKIKIKKKLIQEAIVKVNYIIASTNNITIPIFKNIKLSVLTNTISLIGSNGFSSIKTILKEDDNDLIIEKTGEILLPTKYIVELIRKIDSEFILIEKIENKTLCIKNQKSEFIINTYDENTYPNINFEFSGNEMKWQSNVIRNIANEIVFAADNEQTQQNEILQGINFKSNDKSTQYIATNSHRLAMKTIENPSNGEDTNVVLQTQLFKVINKIITKTKDISTFISKNKIIFKIDNSIIQFQNKQGNFPDISKIIPSEFLISVIINRSELIGALERINLILVSHEKKAKINIKDNILSLSTTQNQTGSVVETIENFNKNGPDIEFICSSTYLLESLRSFETNEIKLEINSNHKPVLISNNENKGLIHLIMPVRSIN